MLLAGVMQCYVIESGPSLSSLLQVQGSVLQVHEEAPLLSPHFTGQ